jgi:hypothetical protein
MLSARRELNFLFARWSNLGPNLWEITRTQTTLTEGTASYSVDSNTIVILDGTIVLNFGQSDESRRYITPISHTEYMSYANQQTQGFPTAYYYDRKISQTVTFWPVPDGNGPYTFDCDTYTQIQDGNLSAGETPDIPYRWLDALVDGLAHRLARIYAPQLAAQLKADAEESWKIAAAQDTENVPVRLAPQVGAYYRR